MTNDNKGDSDKTNKKSGSVTIGDVEGGIHGSIIAGGDVIGATINYITQEERPPLFVGVPASTK